MEQVMDRPSQDVLERMSLAEGVLLLWRWTASDIRLQNIWDEFRGACYQKVLSFPTIVNLVTDALLQYGGSARRSFEKNDALPCTVQAAYKKLGRLPTAVSQGFLSECTQALRDVFPEASERKLPASLQEFRPVIL